jgi:glycosyltransferase involved in cell wall biosynthesis
MRIGIDGRAIYKNLDGIGRYSLNLIRGLARVDGENEYVIFRNNLFDETIVESPNFREVHVSFPALSLRTGYYLGHLLKKEDVDVFHSPFFIAPLWGINNLVVTVHDLMALNFPGFFSGRNFLLSKYAYLFHKYMIPKALSRSRKVIAVSNNTKVDLERSFNLNSNKVSVIYEAADPSFRKIMDIETLETYRRNARLPENFILYVGNTKPYKNVFALLKAFKIFKTTWDLDYALVIAGKKDRFHQTTLQMAKELALLPHVRFFDNFTEKELPLLYNLAKLFVFPSYYEGFGLPPLEAISCGTPVITSNRSSLPEVVGESAMLVEPDDVDGLAKAMKRILDDEGLREQMSQKGIEQSKMFSWKKTAEETLNVYKSIT